MKRIFVFTALFTLCFGSIALAQKKLLEFTFGSGISPLSKPQSHPDRWKHGLNFGGSAGVFVSNQILLGFTFGYNWFGVRNRSGVVVRGGGLAIAEVVPVIKHYTRPLDSKVNIYATAGIGAATISETFRFVEEGGNLTTNPGSGRHGLMTTIGIGLTLKIEKAVKGLYVEGRLSWRRNPDMRFWPVTIGVIL